MVDRLGKSSLPAEDHAEIVVGPRGAGIDLQGPVELVDGFGLLPLPAQYFAEVVMRAGIVRALRTVSCQMDAWLP